KSVWAKCRYGLPPRGPIPRELSLCTTTACGSDLVVIPDQLIGQLDDYFSAFDEIAERHRLEMLKTIGDAYMCVGGVPETNRSHFIDACLAALEMQQLIAGINRQRKKLRLPHWDLRIGLHTGPVIAGVVGRRKFIYDVWGDAVNVAARMESAGAAG